jgi:hypothetical protein
MSFEIDCLEEDLASAFGGKKATRRLLAAYEAAWASPAGYAGPCADGRRSSI